MGNAIVIQPKNPVKIKRTEKDKSRLTGLYRQGYEDASERIHDIEIFLEENTYM